MPGHINDVVISVTIGDQTEGVTIPGEVVEALKGESTSEQIADYIKDKIEDRLRMAHANAMSGDVDQYLQKIMRTT